jgi:ATP-dependent DNA helicase RecG
MCGVAVRDTTRCLKYPFVQMTDEEITALLGRPESDRLERKAALSGERVRKEIGQAICAFSNDLPNHRQPGLIVIGLGDDGSCAGTQIDDALLRSLAAFKDDGNILPFPSLVVQKRTIDGCDVAIVLVQPSSAPPVRFQDRVWIRVGPRKDVATPDEERQLSERRRFNLLPFDQRPVETATIDDLDLELFEHTYLPSAVAPDVIAQNQRSVIDKLRSLRMASVDGVPTVVGILALGKEPRSYIPASYVQFVRFDGADLTAAVRARHEIDGPLHELLTRTETVLEANLSVATNIIGSATERTRPDYPLEALRQLVRNAIMHRSYESTNAPTRINWFSDRIEIINPGGPYGQSTVENFGQPGITDYRNPHIAEALHTLGFVQRFGVGIAIARKQLLDNGNPPLEFEVHRSHIVALLRS